MKRFYFIKRRESGESSHDSEKNIEHVNAGDVCDAAKYWENPDYHKYVAMHGEHFSRKLSMWVCGKMQNRNGVAHTWSPEQVEAAITKMGHTLDPKHKYDAHYLANMAYADYLGHSVKDETDCLQYAIDTFTDPDGYAEKAFTHWIADAMKKCLHIDWQEFI